MKRVVIACGGTGGHFYPGYVLGRALRERGWEVLFVLRRADPAAAQLGREDFPFVELDLTGMPRGLAGWPAFGARLARSLKLARNVMRSFTPRCAVGMGGYVSFPVVAAARRSRVPALVHESNALLGLANRACLPFVSRVALGLPLARTPRWPGGVSYELTGTPVRPELLRLPSEDEARRALGLDSQRPTILVFGGSQGARGINRAVPQALRTLAQRRPDTLQCLHLSGTAEEPSVRASYAGAKLRVVVLPYLQEMHRAYAASNFVICRAGASTVAELRAVRKPAILVPFPAAAAGHQEKNARTLSTVGAAEMILEKDLTPKLSHIFPLPEGERTKVRGEGVQGLPDLAQDFLADRLEDLIFSEDGGRLGAMAGRYADLKLPPPGEAVSALVGQVEAL